MTAPIRPRRSALFMPGSNPRAIQKARELPADGLIFDLEDAVAPDAKVEAREAVAAALGEGGYGKRELVLRVNALDTPWGAADVEAAVKAKPDAILLPKIEGAAQVVALAERMSRAGAADAMQIHCMLETPLGILGARDIARASPRVGCLVLGTSDLTKELCAQQKPGRQALLTSFGLAILVARAHDLAILDGIYLDVPNQEGFRAACAQARELGFDGKTLVHPSQVAPCNEAFTA